MAEDALVPLSAEAITDALRGRDTGSFGRQVHYLPQIGSTNDLARQLAGEGAPEGTLVITDEQIAGRGRMGRRWVAPPNTSLLMSLVFRPSLLPDETNRLVMACSLAAAEAIESLASLTCDLKWPNDLLVGGAKVGGLLAESALSGGRVDSVVVGIGLNVNWRDDPAGDFLYPATSLLRASGDPVDRLALLARLLERVHHWYGLIEGPRLETAWRERLVTLGQRVQSGEVSGVAERVDRVGALWVREDTGRLVRLTAGDATLRPSE